MAALTEPLAGMEASQDETQPATVADGQTPPSYGTNNRDLPQRLKDALAALVRDFQNRDMYDRRIEVLTDRILRFYDDGVQHIYPNYGTGVYQIGAAGGSVDLGNGQTMQCPEYMGAYNIFRARRRAIDAVLTQNPPGIDFQPDHPDQSEDIEAAETAEGHRHLFDQSNDVRKLQQDISRMFELSGRCVTWTHTEANQQKWGVNEQGEPRKMETCEVFGTLESKVPICCESQEKALYVFLYRDPDVLIAKGRNEWIRDQIVTGEAGLGESDWERFARLGVKQARKGQFLTGSALSHLVTEMHCFLRPAAFESKQCDEAMLDAPPNGAEFQPDEKLGYVTIRQVLKQLFPEGIHIVYVGKTYSEAWPESMDDAIDIGFPCERDGLTGGALMEPMKVVQDGFNDFKNAEREFYEKGWPVTWFKGDAQDYDAFVDQQSRPGQFALLKNTTTGDQPLANFFFKEPGMDAPASFVQCMEEYRGPLSQDVTGALPSLMGENDPDNKTATGKAMDRSQAMGMLGPAWANLQRMFAGIYKKAALAASKNPDHGKEITVVSGSGQSINIQLERLKRGSFHAHPDVDSTFPESTAAKRAQMQAILPLIASSPLIGAEFLKSPDNWKEILKLQGFPEMTLVPALAFDKQTRELEILLREAPVPNQEAQGQYNQQHASVALQAQAAGMPEPPYQPPPPEMPSIMPEADDYHQWESAKCQEYLSSEDCWRQQMEGNLAGIKNVRLHKGVHDQFLAQQAAAQAAMMQPPQPAAPAAKPKPGATPSEAPEGNKQVQKHAQPPGAPGQPTI